MNTPWNRRATAAGTRKAGSSAARVTVVEENGELVAVVYDTLRGLVRIPLGSVEPVPRRFP